MKNLCQLGMDNRPRGSMTLVLSATAKILKSVNYPLLPSYNIHHPISNLVARARTYVKHQAMQDASFGAHGPQADDRNHSLLSYKADETLRVQLASLILTLWKKIHDDGCQLDFFLFEDPNHRVPPQLDLISAVMFIHRHT